jgi:hypothetical protein
MSKAIRRRNVSETVIAKLEELGYLKQGKRHKDRAIELAILRLQQQLYRDGMIGSGDLTGDCSLSERSADGATFRPKVEVDKSPSVSESTTTSQ